MQLNSCLSLEVGVGPCCLYLHTFSAGWDSGGGEEEEPAPAHRAVAGGGGGHQWQGGSTGQGLQYCTAQVLALTPAVLELQYCYCTVNSLLLLLALTLCSSEAIVLPIAMLLLLLALTPTHQCAQLDCWVRGAPRPWGVRWGRLRRYLQIPGSALSGTLCCQVLRYLTLLCQIFNTVLPGRGVYLWKSKNLSVRMNIRALRMIIRRKEY